MFVLIPRFNVIGRKKLTDFRQLFSDLHIPTVACKPLNTCIYTIIIINMRNVDWKDRFVAV